MSAGRIPTLPRGVRCHRDTVRGADVLLGPERVLMLDGTGQAILSVVDGCRSLDAIAGHLAATYNAPKEAILSDVTEFLEDLADQRLIDFANG